MSVEVQEVKAKKAVKGPDAVEGLVARHQACRKALKVWWNESWEACKREELSVEKLQALCAEVEALTARPFK